MDHRLVAWGRAVKARRRSKLPPLWLFTDPVRTPDPISAVAALPRGLCGVVFRHDAVPSGASLLRRVGQLCRARRLALVVAGTARNLPAGAGRHLRRGMGCRSGLPRPRLLTSSAHGRAELLRARRHGADLAFLSPAFPTASHAGAPALGPLRWGGESRGVGIPTFALGGITGGNVHRLPRWVAGTGAIGALLG